MRVLVTDAEYKLTLGAIRSLGRRGAFVVAAAARPRAQGFFSRYASATEVYPPAEDARAFVDFVEQAVQRHRLDVILPIGQASTYALARHSDRVAPAAIAVADAEAIEIASSKRRTLAVARELGIETPRETRAVPLVAKRDRGSGEVRYVNDADALAALDESWLLQEYVPGEGRGFFALLDHGEEKATFMHRRLREFPVTGGASTAAESIDDPTLRELGLRLLKALRWHGVAMVEFKLDRRDERYKLMEINPKFWGSLDLAIAAGVDFPWLTARLAAGDSDVSADPYRVGLRYQWVFSDLMHAAARPRALPAVARDLLDPAVENDVWATDVRPNLFEAYLVAAGIARRVATGTLRRPHGEPVVTRRA